MTDRDRWNFLDSLRGVALAGILFVNIPDLVNLGFDVPPARTSGTAGGWTTSSRPASSRSSRCSSG